MEVVKHQDQDTQSEQVLSARIEALNHETGAQSEGDKLSGVAIKSNSVPSKSCSCCPPIYVLTTLEVECCISQDQSGSE